MRGREKGADRYNSMSSMLKKAYQEANTFLSSLWFYISDKPLYYEIVAKNDRMIIKFFKGINAAREAAKWLMDNYAKLVEGQYHVWFGILPRNRKPEKGRGKASIVEKGKWLWADLDYKQSFTHLDDIPIDEELKEEAREKGYSYIELDDYELKGIYKAGNKWVYVTRPSLSQVLSKVKERLGIEPTIIVDSGAGYHLYFKLMYDIDPRLLEKLEARLVDILEADPQSKDLARVLRLPGSINPRLNRFVQVIMYNDNEYDPEELLKILEKTETRPKPRKKTRELKENEIEEIVELLKKYYEPGHRNRIVFSLLGLLVKAGICYDSAYKLIDRLTDITSDEEKKERLYLVDYHYGKRVDVVGIEKLKGVSGLREELARVLEEKGLDDQEITREVSETLLKIGSILRIRKYSKVAWLSRWDTGEYIKWVGVGKQGVYLYSRNREGRVKITILTNARLDEVKEISIAGLDIRNLYKVKIGDEEIIGKISEIVSYIKENYGLERGGDYALARLIDYSSEKIETLYYSPGPWVIDDNLIFVKEPGYTPSWKPFYIWRIPEDDIDPETKKKALITIKKLVEAYKDSSKPGLVLSYAAISPFAHYIKKEIRIMPHLLIHGLQGSGKSILLELIRLLYNINWDDPFPGSDFQARVLLSISTLPAIIDEINQLIEGYKNGVKNSIEAIEVLHRAATQTQLRVSGGHKYGGIYLAIRSSILATNKDISLVPWQIDKFIITTISVDHKIDVEKAQGCTPRTMDNKVKNALPYIGKELIITAFEVLKENIETLKKLPRGEIRKKLIEIGYLAWKRLYEKYGVEVFPAPAEEETEEEIETTKDIYLEVFKQFLKKENVPEIRYEELGTDPEGYIYDYEAIKTVKDGRVIIICKIPFLTKFKEWAAREYGLEKYGWRRLVELLGFKHTTKKVGNRLYNIIIGYLT